VPLTGRGQLRLVSGVTLAYFTTFGLFLAALQRYVTEDLGLGAGTVGLTVGSFAVSALVVRPLLGRQIDRRGRRRFMLGALGLHLIVALAFPFAGSAAVVIVLRLVQGAGHAALYVALTSMAVDLAPPERRASEVSRLSLYLYAGLGVGPPLAEWLVPRIGFDGTWLAAAGILLAALLAGSRIAETADRTVALRPRRSDGRAAPLLPAGVLAPGLMVLFPAVGYAAVVGFATLYAESLDMGDRAGVLYTGFAATILAVRIVAGGLADRFGGMAIVLPGLAMSVGGLLALALVATPTGATVGVVVFGAGFALIFPALLTMSVTAVPDGQRAEAVASFTMFTDVGIGGGSYLVGLLIATSGYPAAFGAAALGCVVSGLIGLRAVAPPRAALPVEDGGGATPEDARTGGRR
jgi:MFS family permease